MLFRTYKTFGGPRLIREHRNREALRSFAQANLAGLVGHRKILPPSWVPEMSFRLDFEDVRASYLHARLSSVGKSRRDIVVLVHGLFVDEQNWMIGEPPLNQWFERELGWNSLMVRYNPGLHIAENGDLLADRLEEVHRAWGPDLGRIRIVGHSMGGLVSRSALHALQRRNSEVLNHVSDLLLMASPNQGADLAQLAHWLEDHSRLLLQNPLLPDVFAKPLHSVLGQRSHGVLDVGHALLTHEDWQRAKLEGYRHTRRAVLAPPEHVRVWAVAGAVAGLSSDEERRSLRTDGLVSVASALGIGGDADDLGLLSSGRFIEVERLLHQLVPASRRVRGVMKHWFEE